MDAKILAKRPACQGCSLPPGVAFRYDPRDISRLSEPPMTLTSNALELLAPAKTAAIGREAILHGADAVYIGGPLFGARDKAGNSISEIAELVAFAHRF